VNSCFLPEASEMSDHVFPNEVIKRDLKALEVAIALS
jgi:hypothetical protein